MKRVLLAFVVVAAFSTASFAQISGGVRAGLNLSNQKFKAGDESESGDMKAGLQLGAYLVANISDNLAIQPELVYSSLGSQEDVDGETVKLAAHYISIPVLVRYNVNEMFNVHVGPQLGFLASAKAKADAGDVDVKDSYKGMDFGLALGVGLDFGKLNAGLRYYAGLANIAEEEDGEDYTAKNSAIQIVVGYKLFGGE